VYRIWIFAAIESGAVETLRITVTNGALSRRAKLQRSGARCGTEQRVRAKATLLTRAWARRVRTPGREWRRLGQMLTELLAEGGHRFLARDEQLNQSKAGS
jgi:hypothetical protein